MDYNDTCRKGFRWDPWPLIRLLTVFTAMGLWANWRFAWTLPALPSLGHAALGLFEAFSLCALFSYALAQLYLVVLLFPLYATIVLNDWFYDFFIWLLGIVLGPRSPRLKAGLALAGELGIFVSLGHSIEFLLKTYCH